MTGTTAAYRECFLYVDAGRVDAGRVDAGRVDAGRVDAGAVDAGAVDAGAVDAEGVHADGVERLTAELAGWLGPALPFRRFRPDGFEIDVVRNRLGLRGDPDDFIEWSTKLDLDAGVTPDTEVVRFVAELMGFLRSLGHRVVAACDFEDELPQTDFR